MLHFIHIMTIGDDSHVVGSCAHTIPNVATPSVLLLTFESCGEYKAKESRRAKARAAHCSFVLGCSQACAYAS
jgi:hypothetical protein